MTRPTSPSPASTSARCSRNGWARTSASPSSATCSAAARPAPSTGRWPPSRGTWPSRRSLAATPQSVPQLIVVRDNWVAKVPLMESVARTRELAERIAAKDHDTALMMRGNGYTEMITVLRSISQAPPNAQTRRVPGHPDRPAERRRAGPGHERRGRGRGPARAGPGPHHAQGRRQLPRPDGRGRPRAAVGRRRGLERPRRGRAGDQPRRPDRQGPVRHRPRPGGPERARPADHRRLGRSRP